MAVVVSNTQRPISGMPCHSISDLVHLLIFLNDWLNTIFLTTSQCSNPLPLFTTRPHLEVLFTFIPWLTIISYNFYRCVFCIILLCALVHSPYSPHHILLFSILDLCNVHLLCIFLNKLRRCGNRCFCSVALRA